MEFQCPHCKISMSTDDEHAGKAVTCPGCKGKFQIPALEKKPVAATTAGGARGAAAPTHRAGWQEEDHANVSFWVSFGVGITVTAAFYLAILPFQGKGYMDIFLKRGWVNYAEMFLFLWGGVILVMKLMKAKRQKQAMLLDILPSGIATEINLRTVGPVHRSHLQTAGAAARQPDGEPHPQRAGALRKAQQQRRGRGGAERPVGHRRQPRLGLLHHAQGVPLGDSRSSASSARCKACRRRSVRCRRARRTPRR